MKIDPNAPAFPVEDISGRNGPFKGLTIRAHFAAMAMQGYLTAFNMPEMAGKAVDFAKHAGVRPVEFLAKASVEYADALIAELNKETP